jgi:hypothetical protein
MQEFESVTALDLASEIEAATKQRFPLSLGAR